MDGVMAPWAIEVERFAQARAPELGSLFATLQAGKPSNGLASSVEIPSHARRRTTSHKRYKSRFWAQGKSKHGNAKANPNANGKAQEECDPEERKKRKRELKIASLSRRVRRRIEFQAVVRGNGGICKDGARRLVTHVWHAKRFYMAKRWGYWLANGIPGRGHGAATVLRWSAHGAVLHDSSYYSAILLEGPQVELSQVLSLVVEPLGAVNRNDSRVQCYVSAMAHHCGKVPLSCIAPVKLIFCPESSNEQNRLCIFVHAAAFDEVFESVQAASQPYPNTTCRSRKGELATLEVTGKGALQLLGKVLKDSSVETSFIQKFDELPNQAFVALEVSDPRDTSMTDLKSVLPDNSEHNNDIDVGVEQSNNTLSVSYKSAYWHALMDQFANLRQHHSTSLLWAPSTTIEPPASDINVKRRLHMTRGSHFRLDIDNGGQLTCWKKCPILIMKHDLKTISGCSLVLPMSWVHVIWMSLVLGGAHVIGQRERRWIMTHEGFGSFPFDFPDCPAYKELMEDRNQIDVQAPTETPVSEHTKVEDFSGFVARSKLLLSSYLQHHCLRLEQYKPMDSTEWNMCDSPGPCFIRIMIQSARKGVPEEGCIIYAPGVQDFHAWLDREQKWQGVESTNEASEVRSKIGFVTSAGPWRSGDAAMGLCDIAELCKLQCWQAAECCESLIKDSKFLVLFQNPRSSRMRPAFGFLTAEIQL